MVKHIVIGSALLFSANLSHAQQSAATQVPSVPRQRTCLSRPVEVKRQPLPKYPLALMEERRRGTGEVLVGFWVTAEGLADTASVVFRRISDPAFAPSVLAALKEWRFKPALASSVDSSDAGYFAEWERCTAGKQGVPVAALVQMPLLFEPPH